MGRRIRFHACPGCRRRQSGARFDHESHRVFLGFTTDKYWANSLPNDWTRVVLGNIAGDEVLGVNKTNGAKGHYHELFIDNGTVPVEGSAERVLKNEGIATFELGSQAFSVLVHELGHSVLADLPELPDGVGRHVQGGQATAIMNATFDWRAWNASTPMSLDIDAAIRAHGAATNTRLGDDTYGFNAHFSMVPTAPPWTSTSTRGRWSPSTTTAASIRWMHPDFVMRPAPLAGFMSTSTLERTAGRSTAEPRPSRSSTRESARPPGSRTRSVAAATTCSAGTAC